MTVSAASIVLIPASRRAHRFAPSEVTATRPTVLLAPITARADEHLAPAPGTQKHPGIVHRSPRHGGLDDPQSPGNTALGAVRKCGSGRSLGRDRHVNSVRGCAGLPDPCDLTPTPQRRHRTGARRRALCRSATSIQVGSTSWAGSSGRFSACSVALRRPRQDPICTIYPHFSAATNMRCCAARSSREQCRIGHRADTATDARTVRERCWTLPWGGAVGDAGARGNATDAARRLTCLV